MKEGKRTRARAIVYQSFYRPTQIGCDVHILALNIIRKIKMLETARQISHFTINFI